LKKKQNCKNELIQKDYDITRRINIIQNIAEKISEGQYSIRITDKEKDGLGNLSFALNKMAGALEYSFNQLSNKQWTQTGIASLNDLIIIEATMEELASKVIEMIARYVNAQVAALYIKENDHMVLYGSYALSSDGRRQIALGNGILGQAAREGQEIIVSDIPEENITITYAAGNIRPNEIIALPVFDGKSVKGAMELGTIKNLQSAK